MFDVDNVLDCYIIDNPTGAAVLTGSTNYSVAAHSIYVAAVGGTDAESMALMAELAAESIVELYHARWPEGRVVNEQIRPGWKW